MIYIYGLRMLKSLDEISTELEFSTELELRDKNTREIIKAYYKSDFERKDLMVFRPVEEQYPSLKDFFDYIREIEDPITSIEWRETQIKNFKSMRSFIIFSLNLNAENAENKNTLELMSKTDKTNDLVEKYCLVEKQFYLTVAREVKTIASDKGIGIENIVNDVDCVGSIIKKVFPERQEAEKYFETSQRISMEASVLLDDLLVFFGKLGISLPQQTLKLVPKHENLSIIQKAMSDYRMKELDRVYLRNE